MWLQESAGKQNCHSNGGFQFSGTDFKGVNFQTARALAVFFFGGTEWAKTSSKMLWK
jgi:hypothetical protein